MSAALLSNPRIFREYDIRGVADRDLTDPLVAALGDALGQRFQTAGARRITLGRDCRLSSPRIRRTLCARLFAAGLTVEDGGMLHSPGLYLSVFHRQADGG